MEVRKNYPFQIYGGYMWLEYLSEYKPQVLSLKGAHIQIYQLIMEIRFEQ